MAAFAHAKLWAQTADGGFGIVAEAKTIAF
jgi:hypothetical protein